MESPPSPQAMAQSDPFGVIATTIQGEPAVAEGETLAAGTDSKSSDTQAEDELEDDDDVDK